MITDQMEIDRKKVKLYTWSRFAMISCCNVPPTNQEAVSDSQTTKKYDLFRGQQIHGLFRFCNFLSVKRVKYCFLKSE